MSPLCFLVDKKQDPYILRQLWDLWGKGKVGKDVNLFFFGGGEFKCLVLLQCLANSKCPQIAELDYRFTKIIDYTHNHDKICPVVMIQSGLIQKGKSIADHAPIINHY